jgi:hypothetical protein
LDDAPTSVWRKGDDLSTDEPDLDGVSADDDGDEWASPGSSADDGDDGAEWASPGLSADDEGSIVAEEPIRGEVLEAELDVELNVEEDEFAYPPAEADDVKLPSLAPMASGFDDSDATVEEPAREPWTPETPPERSDSDPTGPLPSKRKRRWGRR